jgi:hypothetical protein
MDGVFNASYRIKHGCIQISREAYYIMIKQRRKRIIITTTTGTRGTRVRIRKIGKQSIFNIKKAANSCTPVLEYRGEFC